MIDEPLDKLRPAGVGGDEECCHVAFPRRLDGCASLEQEMEQFEITGDHSRQKGRPTIRKGRFDVGAVVEELEHFSRLSRPGCPNEGAVRGG